MDNNVIYTTQYIEWYNLIINNFKWNGLPETIEPHFIENIMFKNGVGYFVKKGEELLFLPGANTGKFNTNFESTKWWVYGYNFNKNYTEKDSVRLRNCTTMTPSYIFLQEYYNKVMNIQNTIDSNLEAHKTPVVLSTSKKLYNTLKNVITKKTNNDIAIMLINDPNMVDEPINKVDLNFAYKIDKIYDYKTQIRNEFLTLFGYNNVATEKKERLITDEVNANNEVIKNGFAQDMLQQRQRFADKVNTMFNQKITVDFNRDFKTETEPENTENGVNEK